MSKAFVTENQDAPEEELEEKDSLAPSQKNYMTPAGFKALRAEYEQLIKTERPKIVEIVSWAAGNGDRSENGDYLYGKKRLREIDRRIRYLLKRLESAEVVDPAKQQKLTRVFFGATVTYAHEDGTERTVKLVGVDEIDLDTGKISWVSPLARALMKAGIGDEVLLRSPAGQEMLEIIDIRYEE